MIKVVLIERFPELRNFIKERLETLEGIKIVGSCDNYYNALELIKETTPHILIYSLKWDRCESPNHLSAFKKLFPSIKIIVLAMHDSEKISSFIRECGCVDGFIGEHQCSQDLYDCITSLVEINKLLFSGN